MQNCAASASGQMSLHRLPQKSDPPGRGLTGRVLAIGARVDGGLAPTETEMRDQYGATSQTFTVRRLPQRS